MFAETTHMVAVPPSFA